MYDITVVEHIGKLITKNYFYKKGCIVLNDKQIL